MVELDCDFFSVHAQRWKSPELCRFKADSPTNVTFQIDTYDFEREQQKVSAKIHFLDD